MIKSRSLGPVHLHQYLGVQIWKCLSEEFPKSSKFLVVRKNCSGQLHSYTSLSSLGFYANLLNVMARNAGYLSILTDIATLWEVLVWHCWFAAVRISLPVLRTLAPTYISLINSCTSILTMCVSKTIWYHLHSSLCSLTLVKSPHICKCCEKIFGSYYSIAQHHHKQTEFNR